MPTGGVRLGVRDLLLFDLAPTLGLGLLGRFQRSYML